MILCEYFAALPVTKFTSEGSPLIWNQAHNAISSFLVSNMAKEREVCEYELLPFFHSDSPPEHVRVATGKLVTEEAVTDPKETMEETGRTRRRQ